MREEDSAMRVHQQTMRAHQIAGPPPREHRTQVIYPADSGADGHATLSSCGRHLPQQVSGRVNPDDLNS